MHNPAINKEIQLGETGIDKLIGWGMNNDIYKKLFAHIPEVTEKTILLAEEKPNKPDAHYNKYSHLAAGLQIDDKPHTVHIILGGNQGQWYYSHILLHIEKRILSENIHQSNQKESGSVPTVHPSTKKGHPEVASLSDINDTTLLRLLQADSSQIINEHGEPMPVFHG
jgi:hypothetical protein